MSSQPPDTQLVSIDEAQRNLGMTVHYACLTADCLAVGNIEMALMAYRSLVLHVRLSGIDVRVIGEAAVKDGRTAA